ncbi:uncharacterized protein EDB91DRAFT_1271338 [Suillus paluster]|uniref:uncharacterized protein n=1 Tax=Suillus paluster TaxID=48578 RepID=UPI001B878054|nr:uncharacterized protein EDB91DRAFT_1271338 [Suillus paluster]KAG1744967.1 hypothetical protein EDB91DRAFT_1271338 [Suillus paluster]
MSIDAENHNQTQARATSPTSDSKGKGKEKEVDPSVHEDASDAEESGDDVLGEYPLERFPSPPSDGLLHERQAGKPDAAPSTIPNAASSFNLPLDPPLMKFTYPPPLPYPMIPPGLPRWSPMSILEFARNEAATALADATLAQVELKAENDQMQNFLNRVASVAGKNVVRKLIRSVKWEMEHGDDNADDEGQEDQQDADDEDSSSDDQEHQVDQQDAEDENSSGSSSENEEDSQDAEDEDSQDAEDENPQDAGYYEFSRSDDGQSREWSESSPANVRREAPNSPDWPLSYMRSSHHEYSGSDDDAKSPGTSPVNGSRKRRLENEDEEASSPDDSPRKKFKGAVTHLNPASPQRSEGGGVLEVVAPAYVWAPKDDVIDPEPNSDEEEYEVENSLTLELEPSLQSSPRPSVRHLRDIGRDPYRLRQNAWGKPELYIPNRC